MPRKPDTAVNEFLKGAKISVSFTCISVCGPCFS